MTDAAEAVAAFYGVVGRNIRAVRNSYGLAQADLGLAVGLTRSSISNIESGRQHPGLHLMVVIAQTLKVEISALIAGDLPELAAAAPEQGYRRGWNDCLKAMRQAVNNMPDIDTMNGAADV